ncbi:MAG: BON domain-containing protein [Bryobacteraceae bacterium]|nr:BON domain-containing protein [Bryobacteraceae bacterium]
MRILLVFLSVMALASPVPKTSPTRSDTEIEADFKVRMARSKLASDGIQIRVRAGAATLTGRVEVMQHKGNATRMAKSAGAREVHNQIEISAAARKTAIEKMTAGRLRAEASAASSGVRVASSPRASGSTGAKQADAKHAGAAKPTGKPVAGNQPAAPVPVQTSAVSAPPPVRRATIKH